MKSSIIDSLKEINISDQKISNKELYDVINRASAHKDSSVRLYKNKEEEYVTIFSWQDKNKWKIDYPIELHKIHKQRYVTHKQCLQLAKHIFYGNSLDDLKGFIDVPIKHFTLDDMLEFKREDEMMLRGEDPNQNDNSTALKKVAEPKKEIPAKAKPITTANTTEKPVSKKVIPPTPSKSAEPKTTTKASNILKKPKPSNDDSFFSI